MRRGHADSSVVGRENWATVADRLAERLPRHGCLYRSDQSTPTYWRLWTNAHVLLCNWQVKPSRDNWAAMYDALGSTSARIVDRAFAVASARRRFIVRPARPDRVRAGGDPTRRLSPHRGSAAAHCRILDWPGDKPGQSSVHRDIITPQQVNFFRTSNGRPLACVNVNLNFSKRVRLAHRAPPWSLKLDVFRSARPGSQAEAVELAVRLAGDSRNGSDADPARQVPAK